MQNADAIKRIIAVNSEQQREQEALKSSEVSCLKTTNDIVNCDFVNSTVVTSDTAKSTISDCVVSTALQQADLQQGILFLLLFYKYSNLKLK